MLSCSFTVSLIQTEITKENLSRRVEIETVIALKIYAVNKKTSITFQNSSSSRRLRHRNQTLYILSAFRFLKIYGVVFSLSSFSSLFSISLIRLTRFSSNKPKIFQLKIFPTFVILLYTVLLLLLM